MRVGRTFGLSQNILDTNTLENGTHSSTGYKTCTGCGRLQENIGTAETSLNLMRDSTFEDRNLYEVLLGGLYTLSDSCCNLTSLTEAPTNNAVAITDNNNGCEGKCATSLCYFRNTVNSN